MQYDKNCKKCGHKYTYIGSAQNGYMWLCKKCNHIEWAPDKIN
jgi:ribosomal protein L37AE/L43A